MCLHLSGQSKFYSKKGFISIVSVTPVITLKGYNKKVVTFLDTANGNIVFGLNMDDFTFKQALAEEHFKENYVETEKYPQAKFSGKILNYTNLERTPQVEIPVEVQGVMTIHGIEKEITVKAVLIFGKDKIIARSELIIRPEEYGIRIPSLIREKIAEEVNTTVEVIYGPYQD